MKAVKPYPTYRIYFNENWSNKSVFPNYLICGLEYVNAYLLPNSSSCELEYVNAYLLPNSSSCAEDLFSKNSEGTINTSEFWKLSPFCWIVLTDPIWYREATSTFEGDCANRKPEKQSNKRKDTCFLIGLHLVLVFNLDMTLRRPIKLHSGELCLEQLSKTL